MNDIIFAGKPENGFPGAKGITVGAAADSGAVCYKGLKTEYSRGDIIVLPPCDRIEFTGGTADIVCLGRAVLQCPEPFVFKDIYGETTHAISRAAKYFLYGTPQSDLVMSALGDLIIGYIHLFSEDKKYSPVTIRVKAEIDKYLTDCLFSLDDAIKKMPLNSDYVRKLFKKETGLTPHAYLLKERMELASSLISGNITNRYSNYTVSQIAESCGFAEPLYFSRVFKKYFGTPPSEYSKK